MDQRIIELTKSKKTQKQIAHLVNRGRTFVYEKQRELKEKGLINDDDTEGIKEKDLQSISDINVDEFEKIESVKLMKSRLQKRIKDSRLLIVKLLVFCRTMGRHPDELLDHDIDIIESWKDDFIEKYLKGELAYTKKIKYEKERTLSGATHYTKALKNFLETNGKTVPRGYLDVNIEENDYSKIKLSDTEIEKVADFFEQNYGADIYRVFVIHHETGVRSNTLFSSRFSFEYNPTIIEGVKCHFYTCFVYEPKQKRAYEKVIMTPRAIKIVENFVNGNLLWDTSSDHLQGFKAKYNDALRKAYAHIGRIPQDENQQSRLQKGTKEHFMVDQPTGVIRHSCVHRLMRFCGNNKEMVKDIFWENADTLKVYAKNSIKDLLMQDVCWICNIQENVDREFMRFCSLQHALLWFNISDLQRKKLNEYFKNRQQDLQNLLDLKPQA